MTQIRANWIDRKMTQDLTQRNIQSFYCLTRTQVVLVDELTKVSDFMTFMMV